MRPIGEPHRLTLPMIHRPPRRILEDGCLGCEMSATYCAANRSLNHGEDCCPRCTH